MVVHFASHCLAAALLVDGMACRCVSFDCMMIRRSAIYSWAVRSVNRVADRIESQSDNRSSVVDRIAVRRSFRLCSVDRDCPGNGQFCCALLLGS